MATATLEISSFLSVCEKNGGFIKFLLGHVTYLKVWPPGALHAGNSPYRGCS